MSKERVFKVTEKEMKRFEEWAKSLPAPKKEHTSSYYFTFTLGPIGYKVTCGREDQHEVNITDYETW